MMKYEFKIVLHGTRMDDEPLYGLTIINNTPGLPPYLKKCQYDDMTLYELTRIKERINAENEVL